MERKFQVFLSSTFIDLQRERSLAVSAIMRMGCIPVGMELFPASDQSQWSVIEASVKEADYYVLIVGGRYGSLVGEKSYTEAEYELAQQYGIPIVPLLHSNPKSLFEQAATEDSAAFSRLIDFRTHLSNNHTCQYWGSDAELGLLLYQGLHDVIDRQPRVGWVRADQISSDDAFRQIATLQNEREQLREELAAYQTSNIAEEQNLENGEDRITVRGMYDPGNQYSDRPWSKSVSWNGILRILGPRIMDWSALQTIKDILKKLYHLNEKTQTLDNTDASVYRVRISEDDVFAILNQLVLLGLIETKNLTLTTGGTGRFWRTTAAGDKLVQSMLARRKSG